MNQKLLVLTPRFPFPPIGGDRLRIYQLCRQLSRDWDLTLLSLCATRKEMLMPVGNEGIFTSVHRVYHPRWKSLWGTLGVLPSDTPLQVGYYRNREFAKCLRELAPSHDGVLAHLIRTGDYVAGLSIPKFLEMTDAISLAYARTSTLRMRTLRSLVYRIELPRLHRYEKQAIGNFDLSVLVSSIDRDHLTQDRDSNNVLVCPIGVEASALPFSFSPDGRTILLIGNFTSHQNLDAALYFSGSILPLIRVRNPAAIFKVVGRIAPRDGKRLARYPGVEVSGPVKSISEAARGASVGVCPIRFGAGMQSKLLEYMSLGIPAVTSSIGLEGLNAIPNRHLLLADKPIHWADQICRLLDDPQHGRSLAVAARTLVEEHYSWNAAIAPLRRAIANRLKARKPAA